MAGNPSVARLKAMLRLIPKQLAADMREQVFAEATRLMWAQRLAAPVDQGALRSSIRVEEGRTPLEAVVKAGGPATTRKVRQRRGFKARIADAVGLGMPSYDYARGQEFGTVDQRGQPFFFAPYRKTKSAIKRRMRAKAKASMKKVAPIE